MSKRTREAKRLMQQRWRKANPHKRNKQRQRNYAKSAHNAVRSYEEWTLAAIRAVLAHLVPDRTLSKRLGKSVAAIQVMRSKLRHGTSDLLTCRNRQRKTK